jgi:hypothetical protein
MFTIQDIGRYEFRHLPERKFSFTVNVSLIGDPAITREQLLAYISTALSIQMDYNTQGMGPNGAIVLVNAEIGEMKQVDSDLL